MQRGQALLGLPDELLVECLSVDLQPRGQGKLLVIPRAIHGRDKQGRTEAQLTSYAKLSPVRFIIQKGQ